jgi:3-deoxy-manno-octulosonate cytidylyltransferase (CMP-KDO synthetase)
VIHTDSNPTPSVVAVIPSRFGSSRLPGKPLLEIANKPMVLHVVERTLCARNVSRVVVATDDNRIKEVIESAGFEAMMTSTEHRSGSDRLAEVAERITTADFFVNVQGDEPLISPLTVERVVDALLTNAKVEMATASEEITDPQDVLSHDVVKVVVDQQGMALYFSRSPIPFLRDAVRDYHGLKAALEREPWLLKRFRKHTGIYAYRRNFLFEFSRWSQTALEISESLEQLRAIERGVRIAVVEADGSSIGVDTEEDLDQVRRLLESNLQREG